MSGPPFLATSVDATETALVLRVDVAPPLDTPRAILRISTETPTLGTLNLFEVPLENKPLSLEFIAGEHLPFDQDLEIQVFDGYEPIREVPGVTRWLSSGGSAMSPDDSKPAR